MPAQRFGKFEVLGELGRGGQGAVLRARDPAGRSVALKLLLRADPKHERRFRQEAQVLAALQHPGIVRVVDAGVEGGVPWLAMALVEGESLRARLDRTGPMAPAEAARLVAALARAVSHCHARGIVHRDLKPENVLLDRATGAPVLVDFGLIRRDSEVFGELSIDARSRLSTTGELRGTPAYMAPEQVNPQKWGPVSPATDVYGLGGILCTLLTGEPPHVAGSLPALMVSILEGNVPDVAARRPDCPPALVAACRAALDPRPAARWPSAEAFAAALEAAAAGRPVTPPAAPRRAGLALGLGAVALVVLLSVAAGAAVALRRREPAAASAPPATGATVPSSAPAAPAPSPAATPASPPGDAPFAPALRGEVQLGATVHGLALAPDRERLAVGTSDGKVRLLGPTGDPVWMQQVEGEVKALAFRPDGARLYTAGHRTAIRAWDAERGVQVATVRKPDQVTWCLAATAARVYATVGEQNFSLAPAQVLVLDPETLLSAELPLAAPGVERVVPFGKGQLLGVACRPQSEPSTSALYLFEPSEATAAVRSRGVEVLPGSAGRISLGACAVLPGLGLAVAVVRSRRALFAWSLRSDRAWLATDPEDASDGGQGAPRGARGCAAIAAAGTLVIAGTFDGALLAWRFDERRATFAGRLERAHRGAVLDLAVTPRGVISAGEDGVVRWWNVRT